MTRESKSGARPADFRAPANGSPPAISSRTLAQSASTAPRASKMPASSNSSLMAAVRSGSADESSSPCTVPPGKTYAPGAKSAPPGRRTMGSSQDAPPPTSSTVPEGRGATGGPSLIAAGGSTSLGWREVDFGIAGKVALVTAATKGIGLGIAQALAREGAHVSVVARTHADVELVARQLDGVGVAADLLTEDGCRQAVEETTSRLGPIDILINNLGVRADRRDRQRRRARVGLVGGRRMGPAPESGPRRDRRLRSPRDADGAVRHCGGGRRRGRVSMLPAGEPRHRRVYSCRWWTGALQYLRSRRSWPWPSCLPAPGRLPN